MKRFTNEIQDLLEFNGNHHNCCHCLHGCWVAASIKLCFGIDGLGIPYYFTDLADAGQWSRTGCGGTDGLGILAVVSASIDAGLWSPIKIW